MLNKAAITSFPFPATLVFNEKKHNKHSNANNKANTDRNSLLLHKISNRFHNITTSYQT